MLAQCTALMEKNEIFHFLDTFELRCDAKYVESLCMYVDCGTWRDLCICLLRVAVKR